MGAHGAAPQGGTCERGYINGNAKIIALILYERDLAEPRGPQHAWHWRTIREAAQTLRHECLVCAVAAGNVAAGRAITLQDATRFAECAVGIIRAVIEACA